MLQGLKHCPNLVEVFVEEPKLSNETIQNCFGGAFRLAKVDHFVCNLWRQKLQPETEEPFALSVRGRSGKSGAWCLLRLFKISASVGSVSVAFGSSCPLGSNTHSEFFKWTVAVDLIHLLGVCCWLGTVSLTFNAFAIKLPGKHWGFRVSLSAWCLLLAGNCLPYHQRVCNKVAWKALGLSGFFICLGFVVGWEVSLTIN